eukprot:COSAG04_NODE_3906_length_2434_cov_1.479229_3_plen_174_part_01
MAVWRFIGWRQLEDVARAQSSEAGAKAAKGRQFAPRSFASMTQGAILPVPSTSTCPARLLLAFLEECNPDAGILGRMQPRCQNVRASHDGNVGAVVAVRVEVALYHLAGGLLDRDRRPVVVHHQRQPCDTPHLGVKRQPSEQGRVQAAVFCCRSGNPAQREKSVQVVVRCAAQP